MYARVVTGRLKPATIDQALRLLDADIRPLLSSRPGFQGWDLLVERPTGSFQAITRWSCLVEAEGASRDGFTDRAGLLAGLLEGEVSQALFEVLA